MKYRFDLSGSSVFLLLGALAVSGALLFLLGMVLGSRAGGAEPEVAALEAAVPVDEPEDESASSEPAQAASVATATPVATPSTDAPRQRIYELQFSAHLEREAAQPVLEELTAANFQPYVVETKDSRERGLYTVRVGPWDSMAEAAQAARAFRDQSGISDLQPVIRHRPRPMVTNGRAANGAP